MKTKQVTLIQFYLIDFADVARGPALLDFQWLETQVILRFVAPVIEQNSLDPELINEDELDFQLIDFFKALHFHETEFGDRLHDELRKPYHIIREIRRRASKHLLSGRWHEYYHGLIICLLGTLRFRRLVEKKELVEFAPRVAFLSAAILLCWAEVN